MNAPWRLVVSAVLGLVAAEALADPAGRTSSSAQAPQGVWLAGDMHLHSSHSSDAADNPMQQIVAEAEARGLDFFVVTDHDNHVNGNISTWSDPDYRSEQMLMLYGVEWTTAHGHANLFSTQPWDHPPIYALADAALEDVAAAVHAQGLLLTVNHPLNGDPWEYGFSASVDGIEVWNALYRFPTDNNAAIALWDQLIAQGLRPTARGGSDCHHQTGIEALGLNVGNPTNWILARERSSQALLDAFAAGHVSVSYAPTAERIEFWADTDADGRFDTLMGDDRPADGRPVRLRIHIAGFRRNAEYWVSLYRNGRLLRSWHPARADLEFVELPPPGLRSAYRVEVRGATDEAPIAADLIGMYGAMIGLTNPIYFGFAPR